MNKKAKIIIGLSVAAVLVLVSAFYFRPQWFLASDNREAIVKNLLIKEYRQGYPRLDEELIARIIDSIHGAGTKEDELLGFISRANGSCSEEEKGYNHYCKVPIYGTLCFGTWMELKVKSQRERILSVSTEFKSEGC